MRERTRRVAACIPAEHVERTYKPGAFTPGDLVRHRGQIYTMLGMLNVPTPPIYGMTSAQVQARLRAS